MADPHLTTLRAAYPSLTWTRRHGKGCTRYYGRYAGYAFPLVVVKVDDDRVLIEAKLNVPNVGEMFGFSTSATAAVARAMKHWITDAATATKVLTSALGGAS